MCVLFCASLSYFRVAEIVVVTTNSYFPRAITAAQLSPASRTMLWYGIFSSWICLFPLSNKNFLAKWNFMGGIYL
ncbi:hypothetical protein ACFX2J_030776 [Malus domestica]